MWNWIVYQWKDNLLDMYRFYLGIQISILGYINVVALRTHWFKNNSCYSENNNLVNDELSCASVNWYTNLLLREVSLLLLESV